MPQVRTAYTRMMCRPMAVVGLAAVIASCGGDGQQAATDAATMSIQQVMEQPYIEGAQWVVGVDRIVAGGRTNVVEAKLLMSPSLTVVLPAGRYGVISYDRPCKGNCAAFDRPRPRCSRNLTITAREEVHLTVRVNPARGCEIEMR